MNDLLPGIGAALRLLLGGDRQLWAIVVLSLWVSGAALVLSAICGVPLGAWLGLQHFRGRRLLTTIIYTGMGLPPVVVGLIVYLLLSRSGPLGRLGWLFTPSAMIAAQTLISLPLVAGLTMSAVEGVGAELRTQLRALGATQTQIARAVLWEARGGMLVALVAGFGSIISEVGAVMLVGGNIEGSTRVLTTAIVLETRKGAFDQALALAFVLLGLTFALNAVALRLQGRLLRWAA
ncbi:MAG TPA: ABC transporter permease [Herpetosiphonaceae bacterium]